MLWCSISLSIFLLSSGQNAQVLDGTKQYDDHIKSVEIENLAKEYENVIEEINILDQEQSNISKKIENVKQACDEEAETLNNELLNLQNNLTENQRDMVNTLKLIQEQEAEHLKLEDKLKEILEVLHIYENQYEIIFYHLKLMEFRRENGTAYRCGEISKALKNEFDEELLTRAYLVNPHKPRVSKLSDQEMKLKILKTEVGIKDMLRKKLSLSLDSLNAKYDIILDECESRKSSIKNLIIDTNRTLIMSSKNVNDMKDDLKATMDFSNAIKEEIQIGRGLLMELRQQILKMKVLIASYKDDEECYKYLKSVE